jgi:hypothetical protein
MIFPVQAAKGDPMRYFLAVVLVVGVVVPATNAQEAKPSLERQISEALRDVHDRGAVLYNDANDTAAAYRMYQGGLVVARGMLGHRPDLQKLISDGMAAADRQPAIARRAFLLHELIEQVRTELKVPVRKGPEPLNVPPREVKPGTKPDPKAGVKPAAGVGEVSDGVIGRVLWEGKPVAGVNVIFVMLGQTQPRVYETVTGAQGVYTIPKIEPAKYVVLITPGPNAEVKKLPERYATSTTSPLVFDLKANGEKLDFVLQ